MKKNGDFSLTRRAVLLQTGALGILAATSSRAQPASNGDASSATEFVQVDTVEGRLRGQKQNGLCIFRGVRYAGAPVGRARFQAPPPLPKWKGVRDALTFGH